jgi:hypothetical protein
MPWWKCHPALSSRRDLLKLMLADGVAFAAASTILGPRKRGEGAQLQRGNDRA